MTPGLARSFRTKFFIDGATLVIDLGKTKPVLSSAVKSGGLARVRYVLNHQVAANPAAAPLSRARWRDPAHHLGDVARSLGLRGASVGLMTAVDLRQLVAEREERKDIWVEAFVTVGVTNAVRAGEVAAAPARSRGGAAAGTINIVVVTNARLPPSAMVTAVQVATESKTAALLARRVRSATGKPGATGTGTDATVVASGDGPACRYSGTHTEIGSMIGRLVRRAVSTGLTRARRWKTRSTR